MAALRNKGVAVTPTLKNTVENIVTTISPESIPEIRPSAGGHSLVSETTATIMFTDIVSSTAITERLGDRRARDVFRTHNEIVRRHTKANGGIEVKNMGDGFMLTFNSARRGVACAVEAQRDLRKYNRDNPDAALSVRMGLSVGEPIREEEDLFGKSVVLAARISSQAEGRQVLVCSIVHALIGNGGEFSLKKFGDFELKGISGAHTLYEVLWR